MFEIPIPLRRDRDDMHAGVTGGRSDGGSQAGIEFI
jgi:hypothetical protein